jgi:CheY-like chemotaxis protein
MDQHLPRTPAARPLVLIVNGHDDGLALYCVALTGMGFDVLFAVDGDEGYVRACERHPDIIVAGLPMRNCDGSTFLERLKDDARTRNVPIVVLGGGVQQQVRERAERYGVTAFLATPCTPYELAASLRRLFDQKQRSRIVTSAE